MTKIRDLQFLRYFLLNELHVDPQIIPQLLDVTVSVHKLGEPDSVVRKNNEIIVTQPSSITKFLFVTLHNLLKRNSQENRQRDKLSLGLLMACRDYVYADPIPVDRAQQPPVMVSLDKLPVVSVILRDIIEPIIGHSSKVRILYMDSNIVDTCRIIEDADKFSKEFNVPFRSVSHHDYPFILMNRNIHNKAAQMAHLLHKILVLSYGEQKSNKVVRNILLGETALFSGIISVVKILEGNPAFVLDFLKFFESNVTLSKEEKYKVSETRIKCIQADSFLKNHIKVAQNTSKHTPQVFKQWHQWSMILGLIEKQLAPMRGSLWPTTEKLKPVEDIQRRMITERAKEKGKTQLNFEELLEVAREMYGHKAFQPGKLYEELLREHRVWKT